MSACLSVRPHETTRLPLEGFSQHLIFEYFLKFCRKKMKFFLYSLTRITGTLHEDLCTFMTICRPFPFGMRNILNKVAQNIKAHILCQATFFQKSPYLRDNVENYGTAIQATVKYMAHVLRMLEN